MEAFELVEWAQLGELIDVSINSATSEKGAAVWKVNVLYPIFPLPAEFSYSIAPLLCYVHESCAKVPCQGEASGLQVPYEKEQDSAQNPILSHGSIPIQMQLTETAVLHRFLTTCTARRRIFVSLGPIRRPLHHLGRN